MRSLPCRLAVVLLATFASAAERLDDAVRSLEQAESHAVLARERAALERIWADDFVVTSPLNTLVSRDEALALLTQGRVSYRSFVREPELLRLVGDSIVTVGRETVVPAQGPQTGEIIHRRYTHVWTHGKAGWRLAVRHASVLRGPTVSQPRR